MKFNLLAILFLWGAFATLAIAQNLDANNRITIALEDGTKVNLIGKAMPMGDSTASNDYYYLPVRLRLSKRADGVPQFLFAKFTTDDESANMQGAITHFLMEWGLTPQQIAEAETKLQAIRSKGMSGHIIPDKLQQNKNEKGRILGPVDLLTNEGSFKIYTASLSGAKEVKTILSGKSPSVEGGKVVLASRMDKYTAQLLASTFENGRSIADLSIEMGFTYQAKTPTINGSITIDWNKVKTNFESYFASKYKTEHGVWYWKNNYTLSYAEMDSAYSKCVEQKAIVINVDLGGRTQTEKDAAQKMSEIFMQTFANLIADKSFSENGTIPESKERLSEAGQNAKKNADWAKGYAINMSKVERRFAEGHQTITLNQRMNSTFDVVLTENMHDWYDHVKNNKQCVYSKNLNDPFFEYRPINFILDLDAKDMFDKEVNHVAVSIRKKRSVGNSFLKSIVIDKKYLAEKGSTALVSYARDADTNSDLFEYQTQWSLRGGNVFPSVPSWLKGDWAGVTLTAPVQPRFIEFEAQLDQLKEMGISRATLQVRYQKFGEIVEENIHVSPVQGQALVAKTIFTDKNTKGYTYRLILNHTTEGKLALEWTAKTNDNYVFATIPADLKDKSSKIFRKAKETAGNIREIIDGKVPDAELLIDTFKNVFDLIKN